MRFLNPILCLLCLPVHGAAAPEASLDQIVRLTADVPVSTALVASNRDLAQTFEVGQAGQLWAIQLPLGYSQAPSAPLRLELRGVTAQGVPDETPLRTWALSPAALGSGLAWNTFSADLDVRPGDRLSLVLSSGAPPDTAAYEAFFVSSDQYDRGQLFTRTAGGTWEAQSPAGSDLVFASYVMVPEPGLTCLFSLGLAALALWFSGASLGKSSRVRVMYSGTSSSKRAILCVHGASVIPSSFPRIERKPQRNDGRREDRPRPGGTLRK